MSLSNGEKVSWEDIKTLYNNLNTQRTRFGFATASVPEQADLNVVVNDVSSLKSLITAMRSNTYLANSGLNFDSISDVVQDTPIRVTPYTESETLITGISNVCPHDAAFFATNYGYNSSYFSGNNGYNSSYFSSLVSFNSSYNSANFAYNSSFNTSNNGYNSSVNSTNFSYNSSNYSFGRSGRTSGNVSYNTSKNSGINVSV